MADKLVELRIREGEAAREWQWLQDTLNKVARGRTEEGEIHAFRLLQHQAVAVGQRRVELQIEMAQARRPSHLNWCRAAFPVSLPSTNPQR